MKFVVRRIKSAKQKEMCLKMEETGRRLTFLWAESLQKNVFMLE